MNTTKSKIKSTPQSIKSELNAILQMNAKRKAALEKISNNIAEEKIKSNKKQPHKKEKKPNINLKL